jgi:RHS repeat-associated protein
VIEYEYSYDGDDNLLSIDVFRDNIKIYDQEYIYNVLNLKDEVYENDVLVVDYNYDPNGRINSASYENGGTTSYEYNTIGALINVNNSNSFGENIVNSYDYYLNFNLSNETDSVSGLKTYEYDGLGRLTSEDHAGSVMTYAYDDCNNRIERVSGNEINTYLYDSDNRLLHETTTSDTVKKVSSYTYDPNGNQTAKIERFENLVSEPGMDVYLFDELDSSLNYEFYRYDIYNRLISGTNKQGSFEYTYHLDGLRKSKEIGENTYNYYWNNDQLILELIDDNYIRNRFSYGNGLIARYDGVENTKEYYQFNGQGDIIQMVDTAGNTTRHYAYDAFGNEINPVATDDNPFRYRGEYFDSETGSYYLRARYYTPVVGRFLTEDSYQGDLSQAQSLHLYTYSWNSPLKYVDPSGHIPILLYAYISALTSSPDLQSDMNFLADSWASRDKIAIFIDAIAFVTPAIASSGAGKTASKYIRKYANDIVDLGKKIGDDLLNAGRKIGGNGISSGNSFIGNVIEGMGKADFASAEKLAGHFGKHGSEFKGAFKNADEYLAGAQDVMQNGTKVSYTYKGEIRTGYAKFMGNNSKGVAKFEFVGTNNLGDITTYHVESGKTFWKMLNGENVKFINPLD